MYAMELTRGTEPAKLLELARGGGPARPAATARRMRAEASSGISTKSTDTDVVTAADRAVERQVVAALRAAAAAATPSSARSTGARRRAEPGPGAVRWILDPIDGTVNYLYGLPQYAVSLAAEVDGVVVAGVVHNAATGEEWTADAGGGACRDGRRLTGSPRPTLGQALVATGFGYDAGAAGPPGGGAGRGCCPGCATSAASARPRSTCAWPPRAASTRTTRRASTPGTTRPAAWSPPEAGLRVTGLRGAPPGRTWCSPPRRPARALHDLLVDLDAAGGP